MRLTEHSAFVLQFEGNRRERWLQSYLLNQFSER